MSTNYKSKPVFQFFSELSAVPRGSGNESGIADFLVRFAGERGLEAVRDEANNVLIKKQGQNGGENKPTLILQSHSDMVCVKTADIVHDFLKDPIRIVEEDGWLKTEGTTLGADNGIGMAISMAILDDKNQSCPPLEVLFTTAEETGMEGMLHFSTSQLKGRRMINLDAEGEGLLFSSCAGGARSELLLDIRFDESPDSMAAYKLEISGLLGGHSGVDIHLGKGNAIILLSRALKKLLQLGARISSLSGGTKENVIPSVAEAVLLFDAGRVDEMKQTAADLQAVFRNELGINDPDVAVSITCCDRKGSIISESCAEKILDMISLIPNGALGFHADMPGETNLSSNIGVIGIEDSVLHIGVLSRSNINSKKQEIIDKLQVIARLFHAQMNINSTYPAWEFSPVSALRNQCVDVYAKLYGTQMIISSTHGGLECGLMTDKVPGMDIVAFGATMESVHSPAERLEISSVMKCMDFLNRLIGEL